MQRKLLSAALFLFLAACSSGTTKKNDKDKSKDTPQKPISQASTPNPTPTPQEAITLSLWHTYGDLEKKALEGVVADWNNSPEGQKVKIQLEGSPFDGFADKISTAIPNGNGPDLFIFGHDRIGGWAKSKVIAPIQDSIDETLSAAFWPETLAPLEFQEQFYGLPVAYKSAVLFYNTELVPTPPKDTKEMLEMAKSLTKADQGTFGLLYPHSGLFHHSPWLFGFGGKLLDGDNPTLSTPENIKSVEFVKGLIDSGIIPKEVSPADLESFFNSKKAAMVINGPWFRGNISADIKYAAAPLPVITEVNQSAKPFLTVEAVMISEQSKHKKEAFSFARFLTVEGAKKRLLEGKQPVATLAAYDLPEAKNDATLQVFLAQLHNSTPTPNVPAMAGVWTPFDKALEAALSGQKDAKAALEEAQAKATQK